MTSENPRQIKIMHLNKNLTYLALLPLSATALLAAGSGAATAATIGPGNCVNCLQIATGSGAGASSVNVSIMDNAPPGAGPGDFVTFDFMPGTFNYNTTGASGPFASFAGLQGTVNDIVGLPFILPANPYAGPPLPINNFLILDPPGAPNPPSADGGDTFMLTEIFQPSFTDGANGAIFRADVRGMFMSDDGTAYNGTGIFSATFDGQTVAEVLAAATAPGGLSTSWSATFSKSDKIVPEPGTLAGLAALAGSMVLLRKRQKKQ